MPLSRKQRTARGMKQNRGKRRASKITGVSGNKTVVRGILPTPDRYFCKLTYTHRVVPTLTSGAVDAQYFSLNGPYDPDISGAGSQPTGFDQLMALYNLYRCYGSNIEIEICGVGTTAGTQVVQTVLVPEVDTAEFSSMVNASSQAYAKRIIVNGTGFPKKIRHSMSLAKHRGYTKQAIHMEDNFVGSASANPTDLSYWAIYNQSVDESSTGNCVMYVRIHYWVEFFNRKDLSQS